MQEGYVALRLAVAWRRRPDGCGSRRTWSIPRGSPLASRCARLSAN